MSAAGCRDLVRRALAEDIGAGDVTSEATVPAGAHARAVIVQKQPGVIFGLGVAAEVFHQVGAGELDRLVPEGEPSAEVPREIAMIAGPPGRCWRASGSRSTCSAGSRESRR